MSIVFLIWLFYPVSIPEIHLSDNLPENCALKVETFKPTELWQKFENNNYFENLFKLSGWETVGKIYNPKNPEQLTTDLKKSITTVKKHMNNFFGIKNCLAAAGGISFTNKGEKFFHAVIYLNNIGYLAYKAAFMYYKINIYKGIKYLTLKTRNNTRLYICTGNNPRTVIITTDLKSLPKFVFTKHNISQTVNQATDKILITINADNFPPGKLPLQIKGGNLAITWQLKNININGTLKINDKTITALKTIKKAEFFTNKPIKEGLTLNCIIPPEKLKIFIDNKINKLKKSSNIIINKLAESTKSNALTELTGLIALTIEPNKSAKTDLLQSIAIYYSINNAKKTAHILNQDIKQSINQLNKSTNLLVKLAASQIAINLNKNIIEFKLPFFKPIYGIFISNHIIPYGIITLKNRDIKPATIKDNTNSQYMLCGYWKHSKSLLTSCYNEFSQKTLTTELPLKINDYQFKTHDIIKILDSLLFLSLDLSNNIDNKNITNKDLNIYNNIISIKIKTSLL